MDVPGPTQERSRVRSESGWGFEFGSLLILATIAAAIGWAVNATRAHPIPWRYQSRQQALRDAVVKLSDADPSTIGSSKGEPTHEILLDDLRTFALEQGGMVIDVRAAVFYREGHVPGAVSLPRDGFEAAYPRLRSRLETAKDRRIAIYCSGADCPDAELVAEALTKLGFAHLLIYTSGWDEWSRTGLPQETGGAEQ